MINIRDDLRPWVPEEVESFIQQHSERYQLMSFDELESKAFSLIEAHEKLMDQQCIVLYAGTNVINPKAAKMRFFKYRKQSQSGVSRSKV